MIKIADAKTRLTEWMKFYGCPDCGVKLTVFNIVREKCSASQGGFYLVGEAECRSCFNYDIDFRYFYRSKRALR